MAPRPHPVLCTLLAASVAGTGIPASTARGATAQRPAAPRAPNVVIVLADDLGIGDPGCYNAESKIPTPRLDAIAAAGMRFLDVHSPSAVCTPTRYGLLTGRYCWRTRLTRGVLDGYSKALIEPGRWTIADVARRRGYRTACVGKWHLGLGDAPKTDYTKPLSPGPNAVGFDWFWGIPASLDMTPYVYVEDDRPLAAPTATIAASAHRRQGGGGFWRGGAIAPGFRHVDVLDRVTEAAIDFIDRSQPEPFLLYVALPAPHTPWLPTEPFRGKSGAGHYGDFVAMVDHAIGRIDDALAERELTDRTLLFVTSDNGSHWPRADVAKWSHRANLLYRGQKADIHEGGHRVPFLARWPGVVAEGSTTDETACLTDLFATLAAVLDVELPDDSGEDSFDLTPVLESREGEARTRGETGRTETVHHSMDGMFAIRQGRFKLILGRGSGGFTRPRRIAPAELDADEPPGQLYDVVDDPGERRNLWSAREDVVARLSARLGQIRAAGRSRPKR